MKEKKNIEEARMEFIEFVEERLKDVEVTCKDGTNKPLMNIIGQRNVFEFHQELKKKYPKMPIGMTLGLLIEVMKKYLRFIKDKRKGKNEFNPSNIQFRDFLLVILKSLENGFKCHYCGRPMTIVKAINKNTYEDVFSIDHYVPLSLGGSDDIDNLVVCCYRCNVVKGTLHGDTYRQLLKLLDENPDLKERYLRERYFGINKTDRWLMLREAMKKHKMEEAMRKHKKLS